MSTIDKIYELIINDDTINTFNSNIGLFQDFYYNNMSIKYNGEKVFKIYEYLLSLNIDEDHETMPYINSKIIQDFSNYAMYVAQTAYNTKTVIDDDYVMLLYTIIGEYNKIKKYKGQSKLYQLTDDSTFVRDYTGAMMIALNSSFFNLSNVNIMNMINTIRNNEYLQALINNGEIGKRLLDRDYIFQYVSRFLFNAEFVNEENIKNDKLIQAIRESKFKDKHTLQTIFKKTNIEFLLLAFDNNISTLIDILEKSFEDEYDKIALFKIIHDNLLKENKYKLLMNFIIKDNRYSNYLDESEKRVIIDGFCNNYSTTVTEEEIQYLLNHGANELFLINLKSDCKDNNWSDETRRLVLEATKNIEEYELDFISSIRVLDSVFLKKGNVTYYMVLASLKCLIKEYLGTDNIKIYVSNNGNNGAALIENNCIQLDDGLIKNLLYENDYEDNPESLHILETTYHEARHIEKTRNLESKTIDDDEDYMHYKETVLTNIISTYYKDNYIGISFERDARITGSKMVVTLLNNYFPYMVEAIAYFKQKVIKENEQNDEEKRIFELSQTLDINKAISKLLLINPSILEKYNALKREYNLDGTRKEDKPTEKK